MATTTTYSSTPLVLAGVQTGLTLIPAATPLTALNYFDGKFLRAADLQAEQRYLINLVAQSNRANGSGVAHGFELAEGAGDSLSLAPGLAIDPQGRVLLLPQAVSVPVAELIARSREADPASSGVAGGASVGFAPCEVASAAAGASVVDGDDIYLITIAHAEALCGVEDVAGRLCAEACNTATDRPWRIDGVVLRAHPLRLSAPLPGSGAETLGAQHLRSRLASAWFADEAAGGGSLISGSGLRATVWCHGASAPSGSEVALGVLVRRGAGTHFVDAWIARRELLEPPAQRYWAWRMAMRPWDVFLAQVLQFQCQLRDALAAAPLAEADDDGPCAQARKLVAEAVAHIEALYGFYRDSSHRLAKMSGAARERALASAPVLAGSAEDILRFQRKLADATAGFEVLPQARLLIRRGIIELPSAGYLPVVPSATLSVNAQVRRMLGEGVDLRFCVVRADFVAHALEEARHLQRISLLEGLDDPARRPQVDVLVPEGQIASDYRESGRYFEMRVNLIPDNVELLIDAYALASKNLKTRGKAGLEAGYAAARKQLNDSLIARRAGYVAVAERARVESDTRSEVFEYSGAARAEATDDGRHSFFYAGRTGEFDYGEGTDTPPPSGSAVLVPADSRSTDTLRLLRGSLRSNRAVSAPAASAGVAVESTKPAARVRKAHSALWVALELARDPFLLARGESARVSGEAQLLLSTQRDRDGQRTRQDSLIRLSFNGDLLVEQIDARGGADPLQLSVVLSGELVVSLAEGESDAVEADAPFSLSLWLAESLRLLRKPGEFGMSYLAELIEAKLLGGLIDEIEVGREWTASGKAEVLALLRTDAAQAADAVGLQRASERVGKTTQLKRQVLRAWQTINPAVAQADHPAHADAIRALRDIADALAQPRFADLAAARLFPAPNTTDAPAVLASLDWVLFHRRRDRQCALEPLSPAASRRRYALYHLQLSGEQTPDAVQRVLARGNDEAVRALGLDFVQGVEFAAALHTVASPHSQVLAAWRQDLPAEVLDGGQIVGGAIASTALAASEGKALATERIDALAQVLREATPVAAEPDYAVLARVPDALAQGQDDGVVVLMTQVQQAAGNCHELFALAEAAQFEGFDVVDDFDALRALLERRKATSLGRIRFDAAGRAEAASLAAARDAWQALGYRAPQAGFSFVASGEPRAADYGVQGNALLFALGADEGSASRLREIAGSLSPCPALTVLAATVEERDALLVFVNARDARDGTYLVSKDLPNANLSFRNDQPQGSALQSFVTQLGSTRPLFRLLQAIDDGVADQAAAVRLAAVVTALQAAGHALGASQVSAGLLTDPAREQILRALGIGPERYHEVYFFDGVVEIN